MRQRANDPFRTFEELRSGRWKWTKQALNNLCKRPFNYVTKRSVSRIYYVRLALVTGAVTLRRRRGYCWRQTTIAWVVPFIGN